MKEKKIFNVEIEEGDAIIRLRHNKVVQLSEILARGKSHLFLQPFFQEV